MRNSLERCIPTIFTFIALQLAGGLLELIALGLIVAHRALIASDRGRFKTTGLYLREPHQGVDRLGGQVSP